MLVTRSANISRYDFRRPNKLNREHMRALEIVGETFARQLTTVLATSLRTGVTTSLDEISQITYDEYVRDLPVPTMLTVLDLPPLKGSGMFHLPPTLTMGIVDRLLGGSGTGPSPRRAPTDIELRLLTGLLDRVLDRLGSSFEALVAVQPRLNRIETNPQFAQVASPTDMIIALRLTVSIEGTSSSISLGVPFDTMKPVLERATNRTLIDDRELARKLASALQTSLQTAPIELRVRFDEITLTSGQVARLRPGDVIPLDQPLDKPLTVEVAGLPRFLATAGTKGKRVACLVTDTTGEVTSE